MNQLIPFKYQDTPVRTIVKDGEPWFVAKDVCDILEIKNNRDALTRLSDDEKGVAQTDTLGGSQNMSVINEPGLYVLVLRSDKPQAEPFRRWVTHEVLPQLRKTGTYNLEAITRKELAQMILEAEAELEAARPKVEVADRLLNADGDLPVRDAAQALCRAGINTGQHRLFATLKRLGWINRSGDGHWRPYQKHIQQGLLSVLPQSHYHPKTGELVLDPPQVRVTPKGLQVLLQKLGSECGQYAYS